MLMRFIHVFFSMMAPGSISGVLASSALFFSFMMIAPPAASGLSEADSAPEVSAQAAQLIQESPLVQAYPELEPLMREAARNNPELRAMQHRSEAARSAARGAGVLPDPELNLMYDFNPMNADEVSQAGRFSLSVMQMIPWPGTRRSQREAGQFAAAAAQAEVHDRQLEVLGEVQLVWLRLAEAHEQIRLNEAQLELISSLEELIAVRYETGRARQVDQLRIQMQRERIGYLIEQQRDALLPLQAALGELLGRGEPAEIAYESELRPARWTEASTAALLREARQQHPAFEALSARSASLEKQQRTAQLEGRPSFGLGLEVMGRDFGPMSMNPGGTESFIGMLSVRLPIHRSRPQAQQARISGELRGIDQQETQTVNRLQRELEAADEARRRATRELELIETELLPRVNEALELLTEAYINADVRFDEVLALQGELLDVEHERIQALKQQHEAVIRILRLTAGGPAN